MSKLHTPQPVPVPNRPPQQWPGDFPFPVDEPEDDEADVPLTH